MGILLLVEDDESLGNTLKERLEREGHRVHWVTTKLDAERACGLAAGGSHSARKGFDLVILDIGLPDGSGLDFARDLRLVSQIPIIFLSAMSSAEYRLEGLETGAEDFIPKPFHLKEFLLRLRRVLDRHDHVSRIDCGRFVIDFQKMAVLFEDGRCEYPSLRDFEVLKLLCTSAPQVVSRSEILKRIASAEQMPTERTIDNSIVRLRQLFRSINADPIRAVRGVGYQWVSEG